MSSFQTGPRAPLAAGCALAFACSFLPSAHAQQEQRIVVTATRSERPLADVLPSTRVITRAEIEAVQPADLPSLLRTLTSIDIAGTGPLGSQASLFLRGADSRQVLVLIDGVPYARADFSTASWQHLALDQVERIEIVRGNLSSLYGAQAIGGVVQVVTRRAAQPQAGVALGSHGTQRASAAGGTALGEGTRVSASLSWQRTDGFSARDAKADPAANDDRDGARQTAASARLDRTWAPGHRTEVNLLSTRTRSEYDGFTPDLDDVLTTRVEGVGLQSRHALGSSLTLGLDLGQNSERFDDPTGFAVSGRNRVRLVGVQLVGEPFAQHEWQLGAETRRERFADSGTAERTRTTDSLRASWLARWQERWQLQLALRGDDSSDFGRATTGLAALGYEPAAGWRVSAQLSSGFSAPSFLDQQFAPPGTSLRAERSRQAELAVQRHDGATQWRAALFVQRQRDRIGFDPVTFETVNVARAKNHGLELMFALPLAGGTLGGELTLQDPRDASADTPLKRRAKQSFVLRYDTTWAGWQAGAALRHSGRRLDTDPLTFGDAWNGARTTLDLTLARQLTPTWRVAAKLDNVTDASRPEVLGYTAPPRALLVTLQATMR